jgi:hypothetical protein
MYNHSFVAVFSIIPTEGRDTGNQVVTVTGENFLSNATFNWQCQFGSLIQPATRVSDTKITCNTPQGTANTQVSFLVLRNGVPAKNPNNIMFSYYGTTW